MSEEHDDYGYRFGATDWDREAAAAIRDYIKTIEPDEDGNRPVVIVDNAQTGKLGIHVFPLEKYTQGKRDEILCECVKIRMTLGLKSSPELHG
jgi:hypothetical protein